MHEFITLGENDCLDNSDELNEKGEACYHEQPCPENTIRCTSTKRCIPSAYACDGISIIFQVSNTNCIFRR